MIHFSMLLPGALISQLQAELDYEFLEPMPKGSLYNQVYKETYNERRPRIIDNGFCENGNKPLSMGEVLAFAEEVKCGQSTYIIAPDHLGDFLYNKTMAVRMRKEFMRVAVCLSGPCWQDQANDAIEFLPCLPYRLNRQPVRAPWVHLLGFKHPERYRDFTAKSPFVTLDTTTPLVAAFHNWSFAALGLATFPRPHNYMEWSHQHLSVELATDNIRWFKEYLNREFV